MLRTEWYKDVENNPYIINLLELRSAKTWNKTFNDQYIKTDLKK